MIAETKNNHIFAFMQTAKNAAAIYYQENTMTDKQITEALIARDSHVTEQFFFRDCRPLFTSIIRRIFPFHVDYDEFVSEFYIHLMEDDACRLRQFQGRSTIYQWLKVVAIRYFMAKRDNMIDISPKDPHSDSTGEDAGTDEEQDMTSRMDMERLLTLMPNKRYVYVIRRVVLQEAEPKDVALELGTNVANLYNIKKRAIEALTMIALKESERYEKKIGK